MRHVARMQNCRLEIKKGLNEIRPIFLILTDAIDWQKTFFKKVRHHNVPDKCQATAVCNQGRKKRNNTNDLCYLGDGQDNRKKSSQN